MVQRFWIIGLAFAFWFYLADAVRFTAVLISHRHLNPWGWIIFLANGYIVWLTFTILRRRIAAVRRGPVPPLGSQ